MRRKLPLEPIFKPIILLLTDVKRWPRLAGVVKRFLFKRFKILVYEKERPVILHAAYEDGGEVIVKLDYDGYRLTCHFEGLLDVADAIKKLKRYRKRVGSVCLSDCILNAASLHAFASFSNLTCVTLANCSLDHPALDLMKNRCVAELYFEGGNIPETAIAEWLVNLDELRLLQFTNVKDFRGSCFSAFATRKQMGRPSALSDVWITSCVNFQQENLAHLQACDQFDSLHISKISLTNEVFAEIAKIENIRHIALFETYVSGGLENLVNLPNLRNVSLNRTGIQSLDKLMPLVDIAAERAMTIDCDTLSDEEQENLREKMYEQYQKRKGRLSG